MKQEIEQQPVRPLRLKKRRNLLILTQDRHTETTNPAINRLAISPAGAAALVPVFMRHARPAFTTLDGLLSDLQAARRRLEDVKGYLVEQIEEQVYAAQQAGTPGPDDWYGVSADLVINSGNADSIAAGLDSMIERLETFLRIAQQEA